LTFADAAVMFYRLISRY